MAKKFKSTSPRSNKPSGVSVSDILAFAAGKTPGEALTAADIEVAVQKAGITGKDAKAIHNATDKFLSSGNRFMLQKDGNYNVYGDDGQLTKAKRSTGNKVGFNAGDIVGLGNNMSKLVGLAKMYQGAFNESKNPTSAPASKAEGEETPEKEKTAAPKGGPGGEDLNRRLTPREILEAQSRAQGMLDSLPRTDDTASRDLITNNQPKTADNGIGDWRTAGKNPGKSPVKKGRTTPGIPADNNLIFGNLIRAFDPRTWERLGIVYNPAQIWDEAAREEARTMAEEDMQEQGIKKDDKRTISAPVSNMGMFLPSGKPVFSQPGKIIGKGIDALGNKMKSAFDVLSKKVAPKVKMPQVQNVQKALPSGQKALPAHGQFKMTGGTSVQSATRPTKEVLQLPQKAGKPRIKMPKESPFEKGGKLPKYGPGGGLPVLNAKKPKMLENFDPASVPSLGTLAQPKINESGAFKASDLIAGQGGGSQGGEGNGLAAFGKVAKYTLPFIGSQLANRELGKVKQVNLKNANLQSGVVSDIPRPNMGLRYRVPTGNDLQSEIAGQKFADAQQRDAEANFNVANATSRIAQKQQIVNNQNRNEMFNTQTENQERMINAQQLMGIQGERAQNAQEPLIAAQHHLATDISTDAFLKSSRDAEGAEAVLKSAQYGSPEWKAAAKKLGFKKGGKIKIGY